MIIASLPVFASAFLITTLSGETNSSLKIYNCSSSLHKVLLNLSLLFRWSCSKPHKFRNANNLKCKTGESLENNFGAIEVSLAFAGDNIWDVAKNLNMSLEELKILNPNLTDPLEYDQKLLVYHGIKN